MQQQQQLKEGTVAAIEFESKVSWKESSNQMKC
jgi:hypothetical protein